jgi:hypothetical protein
MTAERAVPRVFWRCGFDAYGDEPLPQDNATDDTTARNEKRGPAADKTP